MRLLIIGNLNGQLGAASKIALHRGAKITQAPDIESGIAGLREGKGADVILIDVHEDIRKLVDSLNVEHIHATVVGCGVNVDSATAAKAIRAGAKEYLPLPPDPELIAAIFSAITEDSHSLLYRSEKMAQIVGLAEQIAPSDASVLITGESGTGKEVIARHVHQKSKRAGRDLISINCAAIPENLLESELFGHEKGAFTGAIARRVGKFEEADGGTLLLDEISEMDIRLQAKLLRALQEHEIDRVGGTKPVKVNIRVLATSNRDLEAEVKKGTFREDLYFRLNVIALHLPALRERKEDILPLAEHFIAKYSEANRIPKRPLSPEATAKLESHEWRGNVRELENTMHRAVLLASGAAIGPEAVLLTGQPIQLARAAQTAASAPAPQESTDPANLVGRTVESVERDLILGTLDHCLGNRTHAANILGISIRTLRNKLKQYQEEGHLDPSVANG